jgi:ubiquinone biosynthesis protein
MEIPMARNLRKKLMNSKTGMPKISIFSVPKEVGRVGAAWIKRGILGLPVRYTNSILKDPQIDGPMSESRILDIFGENMIQLFNELGPIYGKAGQTILSRLSPNLHDVADALRLTRLYSDWPAIPWSEVQIILDKEIPSWRQDLIIEAHPLGVASIAQVHGATDKDGKEWVVKILKPDAKKRLNESVDALEQMISTFEPVAVTLVSRRFLKELRELCAGFRCELSLDRERNTIERVREKIGKRRQKLLIIPQVNEPYCTDQVIVIERFRGTPLSDVVNNKVELPAGFKAKLARSMLHELLVQVFELGLFHADPHAGNLMLLDDGAVGLYDWGLAGELLESDRRHIAAILKAVMALDLEMLIDALQVMAEESGVEVSRDKIKKELGSVIRLIKKGREDPENKPSMQQLFEACLKGAARLGINVPEGLLLMVKSLITIEGLAKGIDPKVSMARVATPVLFRAARPGFKDIISMGKKFPKVAKAFFNNGEEKSAED